jgi:hypothetical protein
VTVLNDILILHPKPVFDLNHTEPMPVQPSAYFKRERCWRRRAIKLKPKQLLR